MNILRNIILFGWWAIACTAFAQDRNADKVERPNTKKTTLVQRPDLILPCLWYPN